MPGCQHKEKTVSNIVKQKNKWKPEGSPIKLLLVKVIMAQDMDVEGFLRCEGVCRYTNPTLAVKVITI